MNRRTLIAIVSICVLVIGILLAIVVVPSVFVDNRSNTPQPLPGGVAPTPPRPVRLSVPADRNSLTFTNSYLSQRYEQICKSIEEVTNESYFHITLYSSESMPSNSYSESWAVEFPPAPDWKPRYGFCLPPQHSIKLRLQTTELDRSCIQSLNLDVTHVPPGDGWAARVCYETSHPLRHRLTIWFDRDHHQPGKFYDEASSFVMPNNHLRVQNWVEGRDYEFVVDVLLDADALEEGCLRAMTTPNTLRDFELELCDKLEARLREMIDAGEITVYDWVHRRSGLPPREREYDPRYGPKLTDEIRAGLLAEGVRQLEVRRSRWRTEAEQLHTTLKLALPWLVEQLAVPNER